MVSVVVVVVLTMLMLSVGTAVDGVVADIDDGDAVCSTGYE